VVITAGPMAAKPGPMVEASWVAAKSLVVPVDFDAYVAASVVEQADQLVVDDTAQYDQYRARGGFAGWPDADVTIGEALQREATGERRVVCNLGVGALDAALAGVVRKRAEAEGTGVLLPR
jgi:ornithine cyclodeaminase/alanine dehydrogenase-like protein (mu-crystallin family)